MNDLRILLKNTILSRLIVVFILIIAPIYFLTINILGWSRNVLEQQIFTAMQSQVSYYLRDLESSIDRIKSLEYDLTSDEDLNQMSNAPELLSDFEKAKAFSRIQKRLTAIKNSSGFIENVRVLIPSINWAINAEGYPKGSYSEVSEEELNTLINLPHDTSSQIIYWNDRIYICAVFPNYLESNKLPLFIIDVELSKAALNKSLKQLNSSYKDCGFIMAKPNQTPIIENVEGESMLKYLQNLINTSSEEKKNDAISLEYYGNKYLLIYQYSSYMGLTLSTYFPTEDIFKPLEKFTLGYWTLSISAAVLIILYAFFTQRLVQRPLLKIVKAFKKFESGDFNVRIEHNHKDEFKYLCGRFNEMVENLKTLIDQVYQQKILAQTAELKQLQSQINPHFLYNSYFLLHRMIKREDYQNAVRFSKQMGVYFQFITRSAQDIVDLGKEVEHARIYAEIQAMRFEDRINVDFGELPEELGSVRVPRLILQPVIENAFEHGLENKEENGLLSVQFKKLDKGILITVEDNGDDLGNDELASLQNSLLQMDKDKECTGMLNINKRIKLIYGSESGISVSHSDSGGLRVCLSILTESKNKF